MKIIGKGQNNKFLIEASKTEIANLFGEYYADSLRQEQGIKIEIGLEIKIDVAYRKLSVLLKRQADFEQLKHDLQTAIENISMGEKLLDKYIDGE